MSIENKIELLERKVEVLEMIVELMPDSKFKKMFCIENYEHLGYFENEEKAKEFCSKYFDQIYHNDFKIIESLCMKNEDGIYVEIEL